MKFERFNLSHSLLLGIACIRLLAVRLFDATADNCYWFCHATYTILDSRYVSMTEREHFIFFQRSSSNLICIDVSNYLNGQFNIRLTFIQIHLYLFCFNIIPLSIRAWQTLVHAYKLNHLKPRSHWRDGGGGI